jgi:hypothetical protein
MFLFLLVLASASDYHQLVIAQLTRENYRLWTENVMLKMTLDHYEREYDLGNIRRTQNENLRFLLQSDELETEIKTLRKELVSTREKLNDLKYYALKSLLYSKTCARSYKCSKGNRNVEQQTDTRIFENVGQQTDTKTLEHKDSNLIGTFRKCFEAKLKEKNTIYKKTDKYNNLNSEKYYECGIRDKNLFKEKLKIDVIENEYKALVAKCTKYPIFDKNSDEIRCFLNLLDVKKDNSFGHSHAASKCRLKISANDKLELHNFNGQKEQIITFDMKMPIKVRISNKGILNGLLKNELFELQIMDFKDEQVQMLYLIERKFVYALAFQYKSRGNWRNYTLKKTERPESIDLLRTHEETGRLKKHDDSESTHIKVTQADMDVIYMEMDDFAHGIKRKLKQDLSNRSTTDK